MSERLTLVLIFLIVFVSRIPFLTPGYGLDNDGWRLAAVARNISVTGEYGYSRVPGHPVQEVIGSFLWQGGEIWLNGATALLSAAAAVFFGLIFRKLGSKSLFLPAFGLAFSPIIYINSVNSTDHVWALTFILGSLYLIMEKKAISAGIFLGAAIGCRVTSGVLIIPYAMLLCPGEPVMERIRNITKFAVSAGFTATMLFIPGYLRYGMDLISGWHTFINPGLGYVLFRMTAAIWGLVGAVGILIGLVVMLVRKDKIGLDEQLIRGGKVFNTALWLGIALYAAVFFMSPHKAGYLVPIVPLVLLLLAGYLRRGLFYAVCVSLIVSSFVIGINRSDLVFVPQSSPLSFRAGNIVVDILNGPIIADHLKRLQQARYISEILRKGNSITRKSVVVSGESYPLIDVILPYNVQGNVIYEYLLDSTKLKMFRDRDYDIYYLPGEEKVNEELYNIKLEESGGRPFYYYSNE